MLDSGFAPRLVLHFVCNTQQSESKCQSAIEFILLFFDFHKKSIDFTFTSAAVKYQELRRTGLNGWNIDITCVRTIFGFGPRGRDEMDDMY